MSKTVVDVFSSTSTDIIERIISADFYICVCNDEFFKSAIAYVHLETAKEKRLPVRAFVQKGSFVPAGFFDHIDNLVITEFDNMEDLSHKICLSLEL